MPHVAAVCASISIHALREEGDVVVVGSVEMLNTIFLSTPSARRATLVLCISLKEASISIHALREEGDRERPDLYEPHADFYPRPPRGGRPEAL